MTPAEKRLIQKAIEWRRAIPGRDRDAKLTIELEAVIWGLIVSCPQCNTETHTCPGCGAWLAHGETDCGEHDEPQPEPVSASLVATAELSAALERKRSEPTWHPLTMQHVRPGDRVRPRGNLNAEAEITVTARWWPPTGDARGRGSWHVIAGEKHWDDHVVQHGECVVELNGDGRARFLPPEMEIEILIAPAEVASIEALGGWEQRA